MKTSNNFQSNENRNRVINYDFEIVRDFDGTYYVNARNELHEHIKGLPEYLPYKDLKKAVKEALGVTLPTLKSLTFEGNGRKQYANVYGLKGFRIHQEPLAFGLQDKVVLGSFGELRPYAIGCTVTGYRWDSEAGEFLYILQGEDGKQYTDFARNIIPDSGNDHKGTATLEDTGEITEAEGIKVGDTVRHNKHEEVATVTAIREAFVNSCDGYRYLYTLDFGQSVMGPFGVELNGGEFLREAFTPCTPDGRELLPEPPAEITISTDGEGHEPTLYERHDITAGEREAWTRHYADEIRNRAYTNRVTATTIGTARVEARIAYRNGTDDPDGMNYKVCWYDETQTGELHLVECENGISLEQAARHMADFSLLSECGLTLREILYPAA